MTACQNELSISVSFHLQLERSPKRVARTISQSTFVPCNRRVPGVITGNSRFLNAAKRQTPSDVIAAAAAAVTSSLSFSVLVLSTFSVCLIGCKHKRCKRDLKHP